MKRSWMGRRGLVGAALALAACGAPQGGQEPAATEAAPQPLLGASTPAYEPTTLLVGFDAVATDAERAAAHGLLGAVVANRLAWLNVDVVRLPEGLDPLAAAAGYRDLDGVMYAHPNWQVHLLSTPNDLLFRDEWGLNNTGQSVTGSFVRGKVDADIDAPEAWAAAFGTGNFPSSGGARVGILDTGIDLSHVDLLGKTKACANAVSSTGLVAPGCQDDNLHGTHVAGTVGALTNNGVGVAGVAPNAEFAIFKALSAAGTGFYADVIAGIHWLHTSGGAKIISMSIGGPKDSALEQELSEAARAGVLLIAAAGNDGDSTANYPAYHPDVVSVAATTAADERASFSNCNGDVEIAAPGKDVWSTGPGNTYLPLSGTSMATPHVSGAAAMVWWKSPGLTAGQVRDQLNGSTDDLGPNGRDTCYGYGRLNLARALGGSVQPPPPSDPGAIAGTVTDARTKTGIGGATVDCGAGGKTTSSSSGSYALSSVPAGTYTCTASATGYRSKSSQVTVDPGATTTADFNLRAN